mmetsp:Transcript_35927/g.84095  ORF Transcript_35927/g.84095 Transcript_35927/m.84095 type:complete len:236 (+) Transcript_35927:467-1174(+)
MSSESACSSASISLMSVGCRRGDAVGRDSGVVSVEGMPLDGARVERPSASDMSSSGCSPSALLGVPGAAGKARLSETRPAARAAGGGTAAKRGDDRIARFSNHQRGHHGKMCFIQISVGSDATKGSRGRPIIPITTVFLKEGGYVPHRSGVQGFSLRAKVKGTPGRPTESRLTMTSSARVAPATLVLRLGVSAWNDAEATLAEPSCGLMSSISDVVVSWRLGGANSAGGSMSVAN